jgi:hypothetical protein
VFTLLGVFLLFGKGSHFRLIIQSSLTIKNILIL